MNAGFYRYVMSFAGFNSPTKPAKNINLARRRQASFERGAYCQRGLAAGLAQRVVVQGQGRFKRTGGSTMKRMTRPAAGIAATAPRIRLGSCSIGTLENARKAGIEGVELEVGGQADRLSIADPAVRARYKADIKATGVGVSSLMMGVLCGNPLASDPRGTAWLEQTIEAAKDLGADVILVAFFGAGDLKAGKDVKKPELDAVVERLKDAAPKAKEAGVILGIENTLSGRQNADILDRVKHDSVRIYYDVGNSADGGYDVPAEIRMLKDRICQFHFKDGGSFLGEGKLNFGPIAAAVKDIGFKGWIILETANPSGDAVADTRRNADFLKKLLGIDAKDQ